MHLLVLKFTGKLLGEIRHEAIMRLGECGVLLVPSAVELLLLLHERLVPLDLVQDLVLERRLGCGRGLRVLVLGGFHLVREIHLELVLLLEQRVVLGPLAFEFALELVGEILDLLVHV